MPAIFTHRPYPPLGLTHHPVHPIWKLLGQILDRSKFADRQVSRQGLEQQPLLL